MQENYEKKKPGQLSFAGLDVDQIPRAAEYITNPCYIKMGMGTGRTECHSEAALYI
jgi:hypothetical protein